MSVWALLGEQFVQSALLAAAIVAVVSGAMGPLVITRNMAFAVHGVSELAFTGAAAALLVGADPVLGALAGSVVVAVAIAVLGVHETERDSVIGSLLAFGLGLGVLFLALYHRYATAAFNLLFGQITGVSPGQLVTLALCAVAVGVTLLAVWRPLVFASADADVAEARGLPVRVLGLVFAVALGVTVAEAVQVVGVLLVLTLVITPAAAAQRLSANPATAVGLSTLFALLASDGGIVASLTSTIPASVFVAGISFAIYVAARAWTRVAAQR